MATGPSRGSGLTLAILFLLVVPGLLGAQEPSPPAPLPLATDFWDEFRPAPDKYRHLALSFGLTLGTGLVAHGVQVWQAPEAETSLAQGLLWANGVGFGAGLAKEVYDQVRLRGSGFSVGDLAWDALGCGAASLVLAPQRSLRSPPPSVAPGP